VKEENTSPLQSSAGHDISSLLELEQRNAAFKLRGAELEQRLNRLNEKTLPHAETLDDSDGEMDVVAVIDPPSNEEGIKGMTVLVSLVDSILGLERPRDRQ
jgi:hypothetical protein